MLDGLKLRRPRATHRSVDRSIPCAGGRRRRRARRRKRGLISRRSNRSAGSSRADRSSPMARIRPRRAPTQSGVSRAPRTRQGRLAARSALTRRHHAPLGRSGGDAEGGPRRGDRSAAEPRSMPTPRRSRSKPGRPWGTRVACAADATTGSSPGCPRAGDEGAHADASEQAGGRRRSGGRTLRAFAAGIGGLLPGSARRPGWAELLRGQGLLGRDDLPSSAGTISAPRGYSPGRFGGPAECEARAHGGDDPGTRRGGRPVAARSCIPSAMSFTERRGRSSRLMTLGTPADLDRECRATFLPILADGYR